MTVACSCICAIVHLCQVQTALLTTSGCHTWVGLVLYVCAGSEGSAILPLEMLNEGYKASSPGMVIGDVRFKGGMYVELTHTNQHVENIYVDTIATENYEAFCGMAHDVPARNDLSTELVINPGVCGAIPGKQAKCLVTRQSFAVHAVESVWG